MISRDELLDRLHDEVSSMSDDGLAAFVETLERDDTSFQGTNPKTGGGLIWAQFETPNFTFDAFAPTREECWAVLCQAWIRHARQTGADENYFITHYGDVRYINAAPGAVLRDGQELK